MPCLGSSLENLALNLNAVGRHEDAAHAAEKAVQLYSKLLDQSAESELRLANVLKQWATYLRAIDRQEDALQMHEKGAEIHCKRGESDPEPTANSLRVLADDFGSIGLHEDALCAAETSVELYRKVMQTKPAARKYLITSLGDLAKNFRALGHEEDAVQAESEVAALKGTKLECAY
ncbi:hypothetical protein B0H19DRAFT_1157081 [Mycena capillaripes]|nr:hypothetical protein B0H19DRAFT_1157081 [Mycena capillaripes]